MIFVLVVLLLSACCCKRCTRVLVKRLLLDLGDARDVNIGAPVGYVSFVTYPSCVAQIFKLLSCTLYPGVGYRLYADVSVSCEDEHYPAIQLYAIAMVIIIPVAVPATYALLLFRHRNALRQLQLLEHDAIAAKKSAVWSARALIDEGERDEAKAAAESTYQAACYEIEDGKSKLPGTVQLLVRGYEMRCYGFEVFECLRKAVIVVIPPLMFGPGR